MKHANIAVFVPHNGCPCQCSFCNQRTISGHVSQPSPEDVANACETAMRGGCGGRDVQLAFFGGSFTAIDRDYMLSLLEAARPYVESGFLSRGIRISTRPDCIDPEVLGLLKACGVTAIELGAQCLDDEVLLLNRRGHTALQVRQAASLIKERGFELGLQMMTGLYGSDDEKDIKTAEGFIAMAPATVRIYPTVVLRGTHLAEVMSSGLYVPQTLDSAVRLCAKLLEMFTDAGISVIRLGLHAQRDIEDEYLGGAYHPAFRELCEGELYYTRALSALGAACKGRYLLTVGKSEVSKMVGQKRKNLIRLEEQGFICRVAGGEMQKYEIDVKSDITANVFGRE